MNLPRQIGAEIVKALAVLALVFLSFAYAPVPSPAFGEEAASPLSVYPTVTYVTYCGQRPGEDGPGYAPCHACRAGVADLPVPPRSAEPAYAGFVRISYAIASDRPVYEAGHGPANPRAPPASV